MGEGEGGSEEVWWGSAGCGRKEGGEGRGVRGGGEEWGRERVVVGEGGEQEWREGEEDTGRGGGTGG